MRWVGVDADVGLGDCACGRHCEVRGGGEDEGGTELAGMPENLIRL